MYPRLSRVFISDPNPIVLFVTGLAKFCNKSTVSGVVVNSKNIILNLLLTRGNLYLWGFLS